MTDQERKVAAKCRVCGEQLTVEEFRACTGVGHHCKAHLPADAGTSTRRRTPRKTSSPGSRRGRRISESGAVEYPCKAQFASDGVIRRGRLTSDHPSCLSGDVVFVCKAVGHGPSEVVTLFIKDPEGRARARSAGFLCHD